MKTYSETEKQILTRLQRGIDITSRPFQGFDLPEPEVLALLEKARANALLRRFGAVFDARRLGYQSVLCALELPEERMECAAAVVAAHPGVTHCYERRPLSATGHYPTLWFTLAVLHRQFDQAVTDLRSTLETRDTTLLLLPALRRFKIDVVFDLVSRDRDETVPAPSPPSGISFRDLSDEEQALIRMLDQEIPLVEAPFDAIAQRLGRREAEVLHQLRQWKEEGIIRRIGAVLYHRKAGFTVNAMCVWPCDDDPLAAGRRLAARPEITHCYQRPRFDRLPFDLYAMIHAGGEDAARQRFEAIRSACGLQEGELFVSLREFKKTSMRYFR